MGTLVGPVLLTPEQGGSPGPQVGTWNLRLTHVPGLWICCQVRGHLGQAAGAGRTAISQALLCGAGVAGAWLVQVPWGRYGASQGFPARAPASHRQKKETSCD